MQKWKHSILHAISYTYCRKTWRTNWWRKKEGKIKNQHKSKRRKKHDVDITNTPKRSERTKKKWCTVFGKKRQHLELWTAMACESFVRIDLRFLDRSIDCNAPIYFARAFGFGPLSMLKTTSVSVICICKIPKQMIWTRLKPDTRGKKLASSSFLSSIGFFLSLPSRQSNSLERFWFFCCYASWIRNWFSVHANAWRQFHLICIFLQLAIYHRYRKCGWIKFARSLK